MKLMSYLNQHELLNQKQSGFRTGHLTESDLIPVRNMVTHNNMGIWLVVFYETFTMISIW